MMDQKEGASTGAKILNGTGATLFTLAYTFSAMPLTVNFFRSVIPLKPEYQSSDLAKTAEKIIDLSPVIAVPGLLTSLEIMSIQIATSIWMIWLGKSKRTALRKLICLFVACQAYPWVGTVYKVAEVNMMNYSNKITRTDLRNAVDKKDKTDTTQSFLTEIASEISDLASRNRDLAETDSRLKSQSERISNSKHATQADLAIQKGIIEQIRAGETEKAKNLNEITVLRNKKLNIKEDQNNKQGPHYDSKIYESPINFFIDRFFTPENLFGIFLACLFPAIILAVGYYWANSKEISEMIAPAGDLIHPQVVLSAGQQSQQGQSQTAAQP